MKIEIDLSDFGFHYDDDGDRVSNRTLEQAVIHAAADRLVARQESRLLSDLDSRIKEIATERIAAAVDEVLAEPLKLTTPWGESVAPVTTVRELIRESLEKFLNDKVTRDRYYSGDRGPQSLAELVDTTTRNFITRELGKEIEEAKKKVHNLVREKAIKAAADAIAKG